MSSDAHRGWSEMRLLNTEDGWDVSRSVYITANSTCWPPWDAIVADDERPEWLSFPCGRFSSLEVPSGFKDVPMGTVLHRLWEYATASYAPLESNSFLQSVDDLFSVIPELSIYCLPDPCTKNSLPPVGSVEYEAQRAIWKASALALKRFSVQYDRCACEDKANFGESSYWHALSRNGQLRISNLDLVAGHWASQLTGDGLDQYEALLFMTSFIDRIVGDIVYSHEMSVALAENKEMSDVVVPKALRDLLTSEALTRVCGERLVWMLRLVIGPPHSLNIRNLLWHGFVSPPTAGTTFLGMSSYLPLLYGMVAAILSALGECKTSFLPRPLLSARSENFVAMFGHFATELPISVASNAIQTIGVTALCPQWFTSRLAVLERIVDCMAHGNSTGVALLACPVLEHLLRMVFVHCNEAVIDFRVLSAQEDAFYTILDVFLYPFLYEEHLRRSGDNPRGDNCDSSDTESGGGTVSDIRNAFYEKMQSMYSEWSSAEGSQSGFPPPLYSALLDGMACPEGPCVRHKLAHGEVSLCQHADIEGAASFLSSLLFGVLLSLCHSNVPTRTASRTLHTALASYQPILHPLQILHVELMWTIGLTQDKIRNGIVMSPAQLRDLFESVGNDDALSRVERQLSAVEIMDHPLLLGRCAGDVSKGRDSLTSMYHGLVEEWEMSPGPNQLPMIGAYEKLEADVAQRLARMGETASTSELSMMLGATMQPIWELVLDRIPGLRVSSTEQPCNVWWISRECMTRMSYCGRLMKKLRRFVCQVQRTSAALVEMFVERTARSSHRRALLKIFDHRLEIWCFCWRCLVLTERILSGREGKRFLEDLEGCLEKSTNELEGAWSVSPVLKRISSLFSKRNIPKTSRKHHATGIPLKR